VRHAHLTFLFRINGAINSKFTLSPFVTTGIRHWWWWEEGCLGGGVEMWLRLLPPSYHGKYSLSFSLAFGTLSTFHVYPLPFPSDLTYKVACNILHQKS
jgi:hypothetical protein